MRITLIYIYNCERENEKLIMWFTRGFLLGFFYFLKRFLFYFIGYLLWAGCRIYNPIP